VYCIAVLEQPVADGSILFVSGDGRDKAYIWTVNKNEDFVPLNETQDKEV
jgi:hypothetical protein